jgi:tripartite ATP-independent transporter DctM subunit
MFGLMLLLLAAGLPICFVLGGTALIFSLLAWGPASVYVVILNVSNMMNSTILVAVPLFVFMAYMLEQAGIADDLYDVMYRWMGSLKGGLAAGTILACTVVAAMSGISTTGVLLMGIIGLPAMLRRNYDKGIAIGSIMAGGALGPLIPPSLVMIIYALVSGQSVGKLFVGCLLPGLLLSCLFIAYIIIKCYLKPEFGPTLPPEERASWFEKFRALKGIILPVLLVIGVLGSIFGGFATPTEAAAVGAFGAIVSSAIYRRLSWHNLKNVAYRSLQTVAMVMWVIYGAGCFTSIYQGLGVSGLIEDLIKSWPVNKWVIIIMIQCTWIVLGCLMDSLSILMVTSPVFLPIAKFLGLDPLWFGVIFAVNSEMGYLTPPFGVNLIVMKGIAPEGITMGDVYKAGLPFVLLQALGLSLVMIFPWLATWLPSLI